MDCREIEEEKAKREEGFGMALVVVIGSRGRCHGYYAHIAEPELDTEAGIERERERERGT